MKPFLTLALLLALATVGTAQFSVETTDYEGTVPLTSFTDHNVYVYNELGDSLHLGWKFINNTCPVEWTYSLCDFGFCYDGIPLSGIMQPVPDGANAFLKLSVWANGVAGSGGITFWVYESDSPEDYQQITFWFNMTPLGVASIERRVTLVPNPAAERLTVSVATPAVVRISTLDGTPVLDAGHIAVSASLDVSFLPAGVYLVHFQQGKATRTERLIISK